MRTIRIATAAALFLTLTMFAPRGASAGTITFGHGSKFPTTNFSNAGLTLSRATDPQTFYLKNNSNPGMTITDITFTWTGNANAVIVKDTKDPKTGKFYFGSYSQVTAAGTTTLVVDIGAPAPSTKVLGSGILFGEAFSLTFLGFAGVKSFMATPSFGTAANLPNAVASNPEPSSLVLMGIGIAGLAGGDWWRRRAARRKV